MNESEGRVVRVDARAVLVECGGELVRCVRRGKLFETKLTGQKTPVVVGDVVRVTRPPDAAGDGAIESVAPRRTRLSRPAAHRSGVEHVLAANIDQVLLVVAVRSPAPKTGFVDRVAVATASSGVPLVLAANKIDLVADDAARAAFAEYESLGIPVVRTSAETGAGLDALRARLADRTTVFCGPSGVGKSSLLNVLHPALAQRIASVSDATGKGRHTTTSAVLVDVPGLGRVIDTPGVREFGLWDVSARDLSDAFPEFAGLDPPCRFRDCRHASEPACAVKAAVERGTVSRSRYESYRRILESLDAGKG